MLYRYYKIHIHTYKVASNKLMLRTLSPLHGCCLAVTVCENVSHTLFTITDFDYAIESKIFCSESGIEDERLLPASWNDAFALHLIMYFAREDHFMRHERIKQREKRCTGIYKK